tara:strand:- start:118 stop:828 length:711 start_codon:yes stop_codon:yes gene_type:complete
MTKDIEAVKACAFDMFGTVFNVDSVVGTCRDAFGEEGDEFGKFWRRKQLEYSWLRGNMGRFRRFSGVTFDALDTALAVYGRAHDTELRERLIAAYKTVSAFPDAAPALDALGALGMTRAVLTNGSHDMVDSALAANNLTDKFEHKFSAEDVETYKPRPEVYEMARKGLGLEPHEIILVSAHPWDIAGAESYGFQGVWIDRPEAGHHLETLGFDPYYHVRGLDEFAELMAATMKDRV